ncbi:hypothetical protein G7Y89_g6974 [Cudoniella acicularis]|uniref:Glycosyl hydrolase n=1 Tax=Cudoniella acicularis TaxID=354080 RepID=A0A8H4RJE5_9HELO|nr:hypothetical protein G7Y89_g6974 [Cudoniella acicularis]
MFPPEIRVQIWRYLFKRPVAIVPSFVLYCLRATSLDDRLAIVRIYSYVWDDWRQARKEEEDLPDYSGNTKPTEISWLSKSTLNQLAAIKNGKFHTNKYGRRSLSLTYNRELDVSVTPYFHIRGRFEVQICNQAVIEIGGFWGTNILRTCRLIYEEAASVLYGENVFVFDMAVDEDFMIEFFNKTGCQNASRITAVKLECGGYDYPGVELERRLPVYTTLLRNISLNLKTLILDFEVNGLGWDDDMEKTFDRTNRLKIENAVKKAVLAFPGLQKLQLGALSIAGLPPLLMATSWENGVIPCNGSKWLSRDIAIESVCKDSRREHFRESEIERRGLVEKLIDVDLVSAGIDGSVDFMCWPDFDSPSVFCRLLDKDKGGYFSITPPENTTFTTKQQYLPSSNILQTRYIHEDGVVDLVDFFPRPKHLDVVAKLPKQMPYRESISIRDELKKWLVRRVECVRGTVDLDVEIFPAFDYARAEHQVEILLPEHPPKCLESKTVTFSSKDIKLQLDVTIDHGEENAESCPTVIFKKVKKPGMLGEGVVAHIHLVEGQAISFVLRDDIPNHVTRDVTTAIIDQQQQSTQQYWHNWISKSRYTGRWREVVSRSLMILKLLTYEPTGAIIAAPTFSIPEDIGGTRSVPKISLYSYADFGRNWDYRFCWVRDSSFTIYILLRMGFTAEADAYMDFISDRFRKSRSADGALPIMFTIRGETEIPEIELDHLAGYRNSKPVRIGNGAAFHQQFDIYGELMDGIYLYNKYGKPVTWEQWVAVREILDYVMTIWRDPDMSIWEVRNKKQNFVYSKIMLWVAFDRGLRLAEKRCLPCPNRAKWLAVRDEIYEEVMEKGYSSNLRCFIQSYESGDLLDSSILIAPLVFFIAPNDPRFTRTIDQILLAPEKGGLTSTGLVYRYNTDHSHDGVGGREGAFSMCTFWLVEALTRAGVYEKKYLVRATNIFENMLNFSNHLCMFSEEISRSGEQLGNTPQAFSHLALISAAFNLDRATEFKR